MNLLQKHSSIWGESGLAHFPAELLSLIDIPDEAKSFLIEIGLPLRSPIPVGSSFVPLPLASDNKNQERDQPLFLQRTPTLPFYMIGYIDYDLDFGQNTYFCIEEKLGTIHLVDNADPGIFLVNSCLPNFVDSLLCYQAYLNVDSSNPSHRNERFLLKELKQGLRTIDSSTFRRRSSYWPMMLADLAVQI